jgi:hypothetical protein
MSSYLQAMKEGQQEQPQVNNSNSTAKKEERLKLVLAKTPHLFKDNL